MSDYTEDDSRQGDAAVASGINGAAYKANQASKMYQAGKAAKNAYSTAEKGKKVAKAAKAAASAAKAAGKTAGGLAMLKIKICIFAGIFVTFAIIGAISLIPSLNGNSIMHTNDPETLSSGEDISSYKDYDESIEEINKRKSEVESTFSAVLQEAYNAACADIEASKTKFAPPPPPTPNDVCVIDGINWDKITVGYPVAEERGTIVTLCCAYSASMQNGLSDESFEYYQGLSDTGEMLSAMVDVTYKLRSIMSQPNNIHPYGNVIYGADFERDIDGVVLCHLDYTDPIIETITKTETVTNDAGGEETITIEEDVIVGYTYHYSIDPIIYEFDIFSVCESAFDMTLTDPYYSEEGAAGTYFDIVSSMYDVLGSMLYDDWVAGEFIAQKFSTADMTELLQSGAHIGVDTCRKITAEQANDLKAFGFKYVGRYLVPPEKYTKAITAEEVQIIHDAGLKVFVVYETTANRCFAAGSNAGCKADGRYDGKVAYECAKAIGMPEDAIIYFAVDAAYPGALDKYNGYVASYLEGAREQTGNYEVGIYACYSIIEYMREHSACKGFWQCYGGSFGNLSPGYNVYQAIGNTYVCNQLYDINISEDLRAAGMW